MTQPPFPPRPDQPLPPGWAPAPLGGQQPPGTSGYDPTRPIGAPRPQPTAITEFAPPRSKLPLLIGLGVALVAVLIAVTATLQPSGLFGTPTSSASPTPTPSATSSAPGHPFTTADGLVTGRWQVLDHRWSDEGVEVKVWLAADNGTLRFSFLAFSNDAAEIVYPSTGTEYPALDVQPIAAGEQREGWVFFPTYRDDMTLILATESGRQISALVVEA